MTRTLLFRRRDFALAWAGGLASVVGSWALWIALPIHVYEQTGSAASTAGLLAAIVVPGIVLGSAAGVFVDRWDRRTTLVAGNVLLALVTLPLLAVTSDGRLWLLYPLVALSASISQFTTPAENAFLPRLVEQDELVAANSLNALNGSLGRLIGPALGALVVAAGGVGGVVVLDAVSFVAAALAFALVRQSGAVEQRADLDLAVSGWLRLWRDWTGGLRIVAGERGVAVVFAVAGLTAVGEGVFGTMFVVWVRDVLDGGAPVVGWLQTGQAVGAIIGGVLGAAVVARLAPERLLGWALLAFGALDLVLFNHPLVVDGVVVAIGVMVLVGIPGVHAVAARQTILQTHVEDAYRGRVFGALGTNGALLMLAGAGIAAWAGDSLGPIVLLNVQGGMYVVAGLFVLATLGVRRRVAAPALVEEA